jgi:hypothetical protein
LVGGFGPLARLGDDLFKTEVRSLQAEREQKEAASGTGQNMPSKHDANSLQWVSSERLGCKPALQFPGQCSP